MPESSLQKDLARVALGDRAAFERVYQATSAHLFGVALRILGRHDAAEDVLQEAFVSVWHHAGSYQAANSQPMTWLISIVRNRALDVVRSASGEPRLRLRRGRWWLLRSLTSTRALEWRPPTNNKEYR